MKRPIAPVRPYKTIIAAIPPKPIIDQLKDIPSVSIDNGFSIKLNVNKIPTNISLSDLVIVPGYYIASVKYAEKIPNPKYAEDIKKYDQDADKQAKDEAIFQKQMAKFEIKFAAYNRKLTKYNIWRENQKINLLETRLTKLKLKQQKGK